MNIGVLALQGDFSEHISVLRGLGVVASEIRRSSELEMLDGLIIPGGESTSNAIIVDGTHSLKSLKPEHFPLFVAIKEKALTGFPVWGTCMGSIVLAKRIEGSNQGRVGAMDITVRRNAFGPQKKSAEISLSIPVLGSSLFHGIFIRAPLITEVGVSVQVLSRIHEGIVMAREGNLLATAFHPEVTSDDRVHKYFIQMVEQYSSQQV
ncbi:MAG: pyridoxal 5'-phosphate synthase glutaminase subunit PdxT [bacterium]